MILSTKEYDMFKNREDNRIDGINEKHVQDLMESIKIRNMLSTNPILVNSEGEVLSGQHRLEAARRLGVEIFYVKDENATEEDMLLLGISRNWTLSDHMNYYMLKGNENYIRFGNFIETTGINLSLAITLFVGSGQVSRTKFRKGNFEYKAKFTTEMFQYATDIVELVKEVSEYVSFLYTGRFWRGLMAIVSHPEYVHDNFLKNIDRLVYRLTCKGTSKEYRRMLLDIYNYQNRKKMVLEDENDTL